MNENHNKTKYTIFWSTGDTDTCYGRRDLFDLLEELKYKLDGSNVMDGDHIAGRLKVENKN